MGELSRRDFNSIATATAGAALVSPPRACLAAAVRPVPILAYRITLAQWKTDVQFAKLVAFLRSHRATVDEISRFEEDFPPLTGMPLETLSRISATLKQRLTRFRSGGFPKLGINVINTLAHG